MRDAMATFWSVERTDGARLVGHSRAFSFIHGHFLSFTGLVVRVSCQWAMQMQMQTQMQMSPWLGGASAGASHGAGRDLVAVHHDRRLRSSRAVFSALALGPWADVWFFSFRAFVSLLFASRVST